LSEMLSACIWAPRSSVPGMRTEGAEMKKGVDRVEMSMEEGGALLAALAEQRDRLEGAICDKNLSYSDPHALAVIIFDTLFQEIERLTLRIESLEDPERAHWNKGEGVVN